jgi:hypothetical protein
LKNDKNNSIELTKRFDWLKNTTQNQPARFAGPLKSWHQQKIQVTVEIETLESSTHNAVHPEILFFSTFQSAGISSQGCSIWFTFGSYSHCGRCCWWRWLQRSHSGDNFTPIEDNLFVLAPQTIFQLLILFR